MPRSYRNLNYNTALSTHVHMGPLEHQAILLSARCPQIKQNDVDLFMCGLRRPYWSSAMHPGNNILNG
jgi:hypothetical protein